MRVLILSLLVALGCGFSYNPADEVDDSASDTPLRMPRGFSISVWAADVPNARQMALAEGGTVFVGSRRAGNVYALRDHDGDGRAEENFTIDSGLNSPNGVALLEGDLYVAEIGRILRYDDIESRLADPPDPVVVTDEYPDDGHHGWKHIAFGPDGKLYVPVGAPCNVCKPDPIYASITRMNPDGSGLEIYAHGVRNTVGFDWNRRTGDLWFTDNGRDMMGDDLPPDELNRITEKGQHFGYPYCHGGDIPDPEYGDERPCDEFVAPVQNLGPHVAALGMIFYEGDMFPPEYRDAVLIAEHGSWNRSEPIGYRVTMVSLDGDEATGYRPFIDGWLQNGKSSTRPVHLLELPDGSVLLSDDRGGRIFRITYAQ